MLQLLVLFVLIASVVYIISCYNESIWYTSSIDNNKYLIRMGKEKPESYLSSSADTLSKINARVEKLIEHMQKKYKNDPYYKHYIVKLRENYNHTVLSEAAIDQRYTTYTIDKQSMHVCLRTRDQHQQLYEIDILMYVVLHELAHMCNYDKNGNPIQGHDESFKNIFKVLVQEATNIGIYKYIDYSKHPQEYCGMYINSNVL
ncbi:MAG: hypothetical protein EBU90_02175 [Proteobacteria bacterium]|nr:hypothetical protein [Pseudomonadota bacterium]NBP13290.1 hypothetical protein [bacterium]